MKLVTEYGHKMKVGGTLKSSKEDSIVLVEIQEPRDADPKGSIVVRHTDRGGNFTGKRLTYRPAVFGLRFREGG